MIADEMEQRVRTLEEELNGERHVSRYMVEQAGRNSEVLHAARSELAAVRADIAGVRAEVSAVTVRVDVLGGEMVSAKAALVMHGRALDVVMQDVRLLRGGLDDLRRDVEAINVRLDRMQGETNARFDRMQEETNARFDRIGEEATARHSELLAAIGGTPPA